MGTKNSVIRRNNCRNPKAGTNNTDFAPSNGTGGVSTNVRATGGNLVIPETGQAITTYNRITWTTAPSDLNSCGTLFGHPTNDAILVTPGKPNTISCYHRTSHLDRVVNLVASIYDQAGSLVATYTGDGVAVGSASAWARVSVQFTPPFTAYRAYCRMYPKSVGGGTNYVNGDTIDTTAILAEPLPDLDYYFDGDSVILNNIFAWTGTANASTSTWSKAYSTSYTDDVYATLGGGPGKSFNDALFASISGGRYNPPRCTTLADMERKRLLSVLALSEPQRLSLYDLYSRAGERPKLRAGGK
jgi:hypothetical protein